MPPRCLQEAPNRSQGCPKRLLTTLIFLLFLFLFLFMFILPQVFPESFPNRLGELMVR